MKTTFLLISFSQLTSLVVLGSTIMMMLVLIYSVYLDFLMIKVGDIIYDSNNIEYIVKSKERYSIIVSNNKDEKNVSFFDFFTGKFYKL